MTAFKVEYTFRNFDGTTRKEKKTVPMDGSPSFAQAKIELTAHMKRFTGDAFISCEVLAHATEKAKAFALKDHQHLSEQIERAEWDGRTKTGTDTEI